MDESVWVIEPFAERRAERDAGDFRLGHAVHQHEIVGEHREMVHRVPEAKSLKHLEAVRAELDARADFLEFDRLLDDLRPVSRIRQRQGRCQAADARPDYQDGEARRRCRSYCTHCGCDGDAHCADMLDTGVHDVARHDRADAFRCPGQQYVAGHQGVERRGETPTGPGYPGSGHACSLAGAARHSRPRRKVERRRVRDFVRRDEPGPEHRVGIERLAHAALLRAADGDVQPDRVAGDVTPSRWPQSRQDTACR